MLINSVVQELSVKASTFTRVAGKKNSLFLLLNTLNCTYDVRNDGHSGGYLYTV